MEPVIYHNPRCRKSRETLALIKESGHKPTVIEYLKDPPSRGELDRICTLLGLEPQQLIRSTEPRLKELGVTIRDDRSREEWLTIMTENPILIQRPIVVVGNKAALGRPPEKVKDIL